MGTLQINSKDRILYEALTAWWQDFQREAPEADLVLTDLDSCAPKKTENEITVSAREGAGMLCRPFSFSELETLAFALVSLEDRRGGERLLFEKDGVYLDGEELRLTSLEKRILEALYGASEPLSEEKLGELLFGKKPKSDRIRVYINYLRKKTDKKGKERLIMTAFGKGYYIKNE